MSGVCVVWIMGFSSRRVGARVGGVRRRPVPCMTTNQSRENERASEPYDRSTGSTSVGVGARTVMRVRFLDPEGSRRIRAAPYALAFVPFALAAFLATNMEELVLGIAVSFGLWNLAGLVPLRHKWLRPATLQLGHGRIKVTKARTRTQVIDAKSIVGGTTARTSRGVLFTLAHAKRSQPIAIEVANDADADRLRIALGIGHGGFGHVGWRTNPSGLQTALTIARALGLISTLLVTWAAADSEMPGRFLMFFQFGFVGFFAALWNIGALFAKAPPPTIMVAPDALRVATAAGVIAIPYDQVGAVEADRNGLTVHARTGGHTVSTKLSRGLVGSDVADGITRQIVAAASRARGLGVAKTEVTGRVEVLRRKDESPREWLTRLDVAGQMLGAGAPGYRGHSLDSEDLWAILEDPEAEPDLRAAAARVLRHERKPEAKIRIDAAIAAVRDQATDRKLRIAIRDELDAATVDVEFASEPLPNERRAR